MFVEALQTVDNCLASRPVAPGSILGSPIFVKRTAYRVDNEKAL